VERTLQDLREFTDGLSYTQNDPESVGWTLWSLSIKKTGGLGDVPRAGDQVARTMITQAQPARSVPCYRGLIWGGLLQKTRKGFSSSHQVCQEHDREGGEEDTPYIQETLLKPLGRVNQRNVESDISGRALCLKGC